MSKRWQKPDTVVNRNRFYYNLPGGSLIHAATPALGIHDNRQYVCMYLIHFNYIELFSLTLLNFDQLRIIIERIDDYKNPKMLRN